MRRRSYFYRGIMEEWNGGMLKVCKVCKVQRLLLTFYFLLSTYNIIGGITQIAG